MSKEFEKNSSWTKEITEIERAGLLRRMPEVEGIPGRTVTVNGKQALNFSGNNYLGLAADDRIIRAMIDSARIFGAGSTASRLIAGNTEPHRELEQYIASWKDAETALVFGSGYQANIGIITALTNEQDLIVSDELNHASIIDGCRLSKAKTLVYPHLDLATAKKSLLSGHYRRRFLITESVFSMDGDFAPLDDLYDISQTCGGYMMVDEAHATGVKGPAGQGLASEFRVTPEIQMGTLGKALGVAGAYVVGSKALISLILNRARSLIYTTAQPPAIMAAATEAIKIVASEEGIQLRRKLQRNATHLNRLLRPLIGDKSTPSHIVPINIGDSKKTMRLSQSCLDQGIFVQGIRYPSVPEGSARLRLTLMSSHTTGDIETVAEVLLKEIYS